jgi:hypothetical protein
MAVESNEEKAEIRRLKTEVRIKSNASKNAVLGRCFLPGFWTRNIARNADFIRVVIPADAGIQNNV